MPPKSQPSSTLPTSHKSFPCADCAKSFPSHSALNDHRSSIHPLACSRNGCTRMFVDEAALKQHLADFIHPKPPKPQTQRKFQKINGELPVAVAPPNMGHSTAGSAAAQAVGNVPSKPQHQIDSSTRKPDFPCGTCKRSFAMRAAVSDHCRATGHKSHHVGKGQKKPLPGKQPIPQNVCASAQSTRAVQEHLQSAPTQKGTTTSPQPRAQPRETNPNVYVLPYATQQNLQINALPPGSFPSISSAAKERLVDNVQASHGTTVPLQSDGSNVLGGQSERQTDAQSNGPLFLNEILAFVEMQETPWSTIPKPQQPAALANLAEHCHSIDTLTQYKYFSDPVSARTRNARVPASIIPAATPARNPYMPRRNAVALDCEMVGVSRTLSEVARLSAIDYLTGEILIDTLVEPTRKVTGWRSAISGITKSAMAAAVAMGKALFGWREARAELWKYIDADTILVGQALQHDLEVLGMHHSRVVDSAILAKDAVGPGVNRLWGLKTLCKDFLDVEIQKKSRKGHDSVEDAFAAREVVMWCVSNNEDLQKWAVKQKTLETEKMGRRKLERARKQAQRQVLPRHVELEFDYEYDDFSMVEYLVDCGWPHPDTGYDPWSD